MTIACSVDLGGFAVDDEVAGAVRAAAETFRALGATVEEVELGWSLEAMRDAARAHLAVIFGSWIGTILEQHRDLLTPYAIAFAEDAVDHPNVGFLRSLEIEGEAYDHLAAVLERYDLLICPVFTEPALPAAGDYDIDVVLDRALTFPFNMCSRCPVLVVPAARAAKRRADRPADRGPDLRRRERLRRRHRIRTRPSLV